LANASRIDFDDPASILDEEDEEILGAIDEGIRDAEVGRTVPMEEVRKLLPKWITASSLRIYAKSAKRPVGDRGHVAQDDDEAASVLARLC
jgi:hypothetical protein